jgi:hypothetical protein
MQIISDQASVGTRAIPGGSIAQPRTINRRAAGTKRLGVVGLMLFAACLRSAAQSQAFFADGFRLVGSAAAIPGGVRLTPAERHMAGAAWSEQKQVVKGGFETSFRFQMTGLGGLGPGADGFAFVLQNSGPDALGSPGSAGGFALGEAGRYGQATGIPQSIAVFFDVFRNSELSDPSDNFVAICTAGRPQQMRWPPPRLAQSRRIRVRLKDGKVHEARVAYRPPVLTVAVDGANVLNSIVDVSTVVDSNGAAYVGFTASTGNGFENHDVFTWSFRPDVSSTASIVSSDITFLKVPCLEDRNLCTPERALVEESGPATYHVVLPANAPWGARVPNPGGRPLKVANARGVACWNFKLLGPQGCNGPAGNPEGAGALIQRTRDGVTEFSVDDRSGDFRDNEGYFEFDVSPAR